MSIFGLTKTLLGINLAESFIDNVIRDKVSPKIGSVVYCEMAFGVAEHSGIYVGDGKIVELSGDGIIRKVKPAQHNRHKKSEINYFSRFLHIM